MTTITGAFNSALSSLQVQQNQAALISNNIANASTPGYVQRGLPLAEIINSHDGTGLGVMAQAIQRLGSAALEAAANQADSAQAYSETMVDGLATYTQVVGQPSDPQSMPSIVSAFEKAMTSLSAIPNNAAAQQTAVNAAQDLVETLHSLTGAVTAASRLAVSGAAAGVSEANTTLDKFGQNENDLRRAAARGESTAAFEDTRATLVASLSRILPVQVLNDGHNGIAIFTGGGTTLYDGTVHRLSFTPTDPTGLVSIDGQKLPASTGGTIAANLKLRDDTLPGFQSQLDQVAGNLIAKFQTADPTVTTTPATTPLPTGIFTVGGAALLTSPTTTTGLAGSIALNSNVDPTQVSAIDPMQNGKAFRMATGAQAASQVLTADNTTVLAFLAAMQTPTAYTATGMSASLNIGDAASQVAGLQMGVSSQWTTINASRTSQATAAQSNLSNQTGVNVDEQLQRLLVVQRTYSASAQVVQIVMKMLDQMNQIAAA